MAIEIWLPVVGYEGSYEVSSIGGIRSIDRIIDTNKGYWVRPGKAMATTICKGYARVGLTVNEKQKHYFIQRLIANAFIPNPLNKKEVNHINGDKLDNRVENLAWVTPSENMRHAYATGLSKGLHPTKLKSSLKIKDVTTGKIYDSAGQAAKELGLNSRMLRRRLSGDRPNKTSLRLLSECE